MPKLAIEVQKMLGVEDHVVIVHGYTFDRNTLDIWFEDGNIVRLEHKNGELIKRDYDRWFNSFFFFDNVKRWYRGFTNASINVKLVELFETFGRPLSTTDGGHYPSPATLSELK